MYVRSEVSRRWLWRMVSSGMLRPLALLRTDVSEELSASCLRRLFVTVSVVPSSLILVTLMEEVLSSSETSDMTRATQRNIPEDTILYSMCSSKTSNLLLVYYRMSSSRWTEIANNARQGDVACFRKVSKIPLTVPIRAAGFDTHSNKGMLRDTHQMLCPHHMSPI
jgi:hypothetical protein